MRRLLSLLALVSFAGAAFAAGRPAAAHKPASPVSLSPPAISLGESRPLETPLGNKGIADVSAVWIGMIRSARRSLDLEHFYFSHRRGEALQPVLDEIGRAAIRGVHVRLLLDANMSRTYPQPADSFATIPNVELRRVDYKKLAGGVQHAKFMIVDGREGWLGSQNLDWRSLRQIHELGARVRDERVAGAMEAVFEADWQGADTTRAFAAGTFAGTTWPVRLQESGRDSATVWLGASPQKTTPAGIPWDRDLLVQRLHEAKHEIVAQTLQFGVASYGIVDSSLYNALVAAARRGVKVKFIVSDWTLGGKNEATLRSLAAVPNIEVKISRLPEWSGGYIPFARVEHCKYMVADSTWLWVGTSNWEPSYFANTRNLGLTILSRRLAGQARAVFTASWTAPSALAFGPDTKIAPREHGEKAPAGAKVYGE